MSEIADTQKEIIDFIENNIDPTKPAIFVFEDTNHHMELLSKFVSVFLPQSTKFFITNRFDRKLEPNEKIIEPNSDLLFSFHTWIKITKFDQQIFIILDKNLSEFPKMQEIGGQEIGTLILRAMRENPKLKVKLAFCSIKGWDDERIPELEGVRHLSKPIDALEFKKFLSITEI